jgi:alpha-L-fucosidase 2
VPAALTTSEQRTRWQELLNELPALPTAEENGTKWMKPADSYSERHNQENAELYGVFPYNLQGVGRPDLELARETYRRRLFRATGCWRYEAILAARLGFTEDAKGYLLTNILEKFHTIDPIEQAKVTPSRFPVFWHTGDWVPDQDHAGVIVNALQSMLMVTGLDGGIILLPAWPGDWNASFKLHAPYQTTIEGRIENGRITELTVTPESRRKDIVL